jgi:hypothetical protein
MSTTAAPAKYRSLQSLAARLRRDLNGVRKRRASARAKGVSAQRSHNFVLLFAHNSVGKTRLSMEFKDLGKRGNNRDTLYFNAFTEDLFDWHNDLDNDKERRLLFKSQSRFFEGLEGMGIENQIRPHLHRHADFDFDIDYDEAAISFEREVVVAGRSMIIKDIKISRGEENIFVWCFFLAIAQLAIEAEKGQPYDWVKFIYIDDPISSLDEHNSIAVASQLGAMLRDGKDKVKVVVSTHHGLFFNVMFNELTGGRTPSGDKLKIAKKAYVLHRSEGSKTYTLRDTSDTPFLHHMFALSELRTVAKSGKIYPHHFAILRSILEKTAIFFGNQHISACFDGMPERALYSRVLNVKSHARYSVYDPEQLSDADKTMFRMILEAFHSRFPFNTQQL